MFCSRIATYTLPNTIDPDFGKSCPHFCDVREFNGGASYDPKTRKLSIFPPLIKDPRIYILKCTITDKGYPSK